MKTVSLFELLSSSSLCTFRDAETYKHPGIRIGVSMMEWIFLIIWAISIPARSRFLFSFDYGLSVFIASGICYFIHTQYVYFFPNFSLPGKVSTRSIYGYAFNGELKELQRLKVPEKLKQVNMEWDDDNPENSKLPDGSDRESAHGYAFYGELDQFKNKTFGWKYFDMGHSKYDHRDTRESLERK